MTTTPALAAAYQQLAMDPYIELYELDTTPLYLIHGVAQPGGQVYRWTSGIIDARTNGTIPAGPTQTVSTVTLDRLAPLVAGRAYRIVVNLNPDGVTDPQMVSSFDTVPLVTAAGIVTVSRVSLSAPFGAVPAAGMAYTLFGTNAVTFRGYTYAPMPVEVVGYEWSNQGKLPRPKLRLSNIGGFASALVIGQGDLRGATVTRLRTTRQFLDDGDSPDPTAFAEPDIYTVDRKSAHTKTMVEWELAALLDQQGIKLPKRVMLRDTCSLKYRRWIMPAAGAAGFVYGDCPYTGSSYFGKDNLSTFDATSDECSLRQTGCTLRFGVGARLPFGAFPGLSVTR
jgi:lambda family phage minor tail protein L